MLHQQWTGLNCEALSDIICFGLLRLAINLLRHKMNCSADMSLTSSKWTPLLTEEVNRQTHTCCADDLLSTFKYKGPC